MLRLQANSPWRLRFPLSRTVRPPASIETTEAQIFAGAPRVLVESLLFLRTQFGQPLLRIIQHRTAITFTLDGNQLLVGIGRPGASKPLFAAAEIIIGRWKISGGGTVKQLHRLTTVFHAQIEFRVRLHVEPCIQIGSPEIVMAHPGVEHLVAVGEQLNRLARILLLESNLALDQLGISLS